MMTSSTTSPIQCPAFIFAMSVKNSDNERGIGTLISSVAKELKKAPGLDRTSAARTKSVRWSHAHKRLPTPAIRFSLIASTRQPSVDQLEVPSSQNLQSRCESHCAPDQPELHTQRPSSFICSSSVPVQLPRPSHAAGSAAHSAYVRVAFERSSSNSSMQRSISSLPLKTARRARRSHSEALPSSL